ncbi:class I SAM-dependent methyltransferase [Paenibacillus kobensis]|uniref:class I SAM-dependent methyltransferase n=1 Tax=Paenibacillus kobensis TaxID=59841 RepID=UPI000FD8C3E7|nr:class I SAM-dependent methyltransferase [Paenibacillus kobensis]
MEAWKQFFDMDYLAFSESILTMERTQQEVKDLIAILNLKAGDRILDLGCGQGRIAIPLAKMGFRVTGYDGAAALINRAKQRAVDEKVDIEFIQADMRQLKMPDTFDAVINLGTAFGYVPKEEEDEQIIKSIYESLKPKGQFVQDVENREFKINNLTEKIWQNMGDTYVWTNRRFNDRTGRWTEIVQWQDKGQLKETVLDFRMYSVRELIRMQETAGFQTIEIYGGLNQAPYNRTSLRTVMHAFKK